MILNQSENTEVKTNITSKEQEFKIQSSEKAFKVLSSGLYQDKISAIIRELSTNAWDSHKEAGQKRPFQVHLPNTLEPHFSVKDFGVGMNPEEVENLYTTYFSSSKTDSNDFIGALGLGSKSPFSYTTMFTVTSVKEGMRGVYSCYINENGVPVVNQIELEPTFEKNGVEVSFPVKREDFTLFIEKAAKIFWAFKDGRKPEVTGATLKYESAYKAIDTDNNIIASTKTWAILNSWAYPFSGSSYRKATFVRMGNVMYPVDWKPFDDLELDETQARDLQALQRVNFLIEMPLGSVSVDPGREALDYDQMTMKNIFEAVRKAMDTFRSTILDKARKHLSPFEGLTLYQESMRTLAGASRQEETLRFKGQTWKFYQGNLLIDDPTNVRVLEVASSKRSTSGFTIRKKESPLVGKVVMSLSKESIFIVAEKASQVTSAYTMEKVKKAFIEKKFETEWKHVDQVVLVNGQDVLENIIGDPIKEVYSFSDLPSPEATSTSSEDIKDWNFWREPLEDAKETLILYTVMKSRAYHTVVDGKLVKGYDNESFEGDVKTSLSLLRYLGYNTIMKIVPYPVWKETKVPNGWETPFKAIERILLEEKVSLNERIAKSQKITGITNSLDFFEPYDGKKLAEATYQPGSLFKEMLDLYNSAKKEEDPDSDLSYIIRQGLSKVVNYHQENKEELLGILKVNEKIQMNDKSLFETYPMLEAVENGCRWKSTIGGISLLQAITDYVNMVDSHL